MSPSAGALRTVGTKPLLRAQQLALTHDERIDTLMLDPISRGVPSLELADSIVAAGVTLTIDGASSLDISIHDPDWLIERSGILNDTAGRRRLASAVVTVDELRFRLVKASRQNPTILALTFEDEVAVLLRQHNKKFAATRGSVTRGQFLEGLVREVKARDIPFFSPEGAQKFPNGVKLPDYPDSRPAAGQTGFADAIKLKIKGQTADAEQMRQMATALGVADQENADPRPTLAMVVAGIGESSFRDVPNAAGSPYGGVFQGRKDRHLSTSEQARYFLRGGQGFQAGGAIAAARENPGWSAGTIAYKVEGDISNFPSAQAAEHFYQQHAAEARRIISAWGSGRGASSDEVVRTKAYQFTRGDSGKKETSWATGLRLAAEVQWRFYAIGGVVFFVSDDYLVSLPAGLIIDEFDQAGLLEPPSYDVDLGKPVSEVDLRVAANLWGVLPGRVTRFSEDFGPIAGDWIVNRVELNLLDATDVAVNLAKPMPPLPEPAPDVITRSSGAGGGSGSAATSDLPAGAGRAIAWARSRLGHYKEEFGANTGTELNRLEQSFGMQGAPWCAMFATTALVEGGVNRDCRTAAVAQIRQWAEAGTHGYEKGFRATPQPGDLMCFGTAHVAFVEKVDRETVKTIEGNTSANQVARGSRAKSSGVFVRPDYPN